MARLTHITSIYMWVGLLGDLLHKESYNDIYTYIYFFAGLVTANHKNNVHIG